MRILLVTDAWRPQINGVVRTLETVRRELVAMGHTLRVVSPIGFATVPCPTYPEIRLAVWPQRGVERAFEEFRPAAVHIATEGSLGLAARSLCVKNGIPFTTSLHTRFPDYLRERFKLPLRFTWSLLRWFHGPAVRVMVPTERLRLELLDRGFTNPVRWTRGVDVKLFRPGLQPALELPGPVFLYVGRLAPEKDVEGFLSLDLPGTKLVVGDGPSRADLEKRFPDAHFVGAKRGEELAAHYASGDVLVFPSRTDTFGLVLLEALACGVPIAARPVPGPVDVIGDAPVGVLAEDLQAAALGALDCDREAAREFALEFSWRRCAELFHAHLEPLEWAQRELAHATPGLDAH